MRHNLKKVILCCSFAPFCSALLCSAGYSQSDALANFLSSTPKSINTFGRDEKGAARKVNEEYRIDIGKSSVGIDQFIKWKVTSCNQYNAARNGYILAYDPIFQNPKAISNYKLSLSLTWSSEYSFSFSKSEGKETSNRLSTSFGVSRFANVKDEVSSISSSSTTVGHSYTFGKTVEYKREYTFDFSKVPDGYVVSPCFVCNAMTIDYTYTYYDHWWWGDYPVRTGGMKDVENSILIYDPSTVFITYCIKETGSSGSPTLYFKA